jgi:hypothetical protein
MRAKLPLAAVADKQRLQVLPGNRQAFQAVLGHERDGLVARRPRLDVGFVDRRPHPRQHRLPALEQGKGGLGIGDPVGSGDEQAPGPVAGDLEEVEVAAMVAAVEAVVVGRPSDPAALGDSGRSPSLG